MSALIAQRPEAFDLAQTEADPATRSATLLRFITCGSVDDGKSTLIGRLLYDSKAVLEDHLSALARDSRKFGTQGDNLDFALLVDGLSAEREQGITIDVAYRYFATGRRSFIVADTPGHDQYTRNMATGASTADLAIILVDARKKILPQTRRHSFIASALGVRHIVVAVNKMDLVDYSQARFDEIVGDYSEATRSLGFLSVACIPISARDGDNVATASTRLGWYAGPQLLHYLETVDVSDVSARAEMFRMPVQWVNRPNSEFRGYSGTIANGLVRTGDAVVILPRGGRSRVTGVLGPDGELPMGRRGQALTLTLADDVDISRGDVMVAAGAVSSPSRHFTAQLIWTSETPLQADADYTLKLGTAEARARVHIAQSIDIHSFLPQDAQGLALNEIGLATITLDRKIAALPYGEDKILGGFILIDRVSHATVAMGFVERLIKTEPSIEPALRQGRLNKIVGLPGSEVRSRFVRALSWRLGSAALLGGSIAAITASPGLGLAVGVVDAAVRPLLSALHIGLWNCLAKTNRDVNEGGAGI
jgi:bifunctional enzyme CysN/CysC